MKLSERIYTFAFKVLANKIDPLIPHLEDLRRSMESAHIKISFKAYVSTMILLSILTFIICEPITFTIIYMFLIKNLLRASLMSIGLSITIGLTVFWILYLYPAYVTGNRRRAIDSSMPYTVSYMAVLAMAQVSPADIFRSLAKINTPPEVSDEAKEIVRDIEIFGYDILSALEIAAERTPSTYLAEVLRGIATITRIGGDLKKYLLEEAKRFIGIRRTIIRKINSTLLSIAEIYIMTSIVMPMLIVIISSIMAFLGGSIGGLNAKLVILIITYVFIPTVFISFLTIVDAYMPED